MSRNYDKDCVDEATKRLDFRSAIRKEAGDVQSILGANVDATHILIVQLGAIQEQLKTQGIDLQCFASREGVVIDSLYQQHKDVEEPSLPYQFKVDLGQSSIEIKSTKVAELYQAKEKS